MTVLATDTFTRSDADDLGANWTEVKGGFQIVSNAVQMWGDAGVDSYAFYDAVAFPNDHYSKAKIVALGASDSVAGVAVRMTGTAAGGNLACYVGFVDAAGTTASIHWWNSGTYQAQLTSFGVTFTAGDTLELRAVGTTISLYINGSLAGSTTDSNLASGSAGLGSYVSVEANSATWDDWEGGDFGAAPRAQRLLLLGVN